MVDKTRFSTLFSKPMAATTASVIPVQPETVPHLEKKPQVSLTGRRDRLRTLTRLQEGLIPAVLLLALTLMMDMLIYPIEAAAHDEGLLIYLFLVLAMGIFALEKSTTQRGSETSRAISGMVAGQFFWHTLWIIHLVTGLELNGLGTVMVLVMVAAIGLTLWKPVFPLGVKFFLLSFLASWVSRVFVNYSILQAPSAGFSTFLFYASGFLGLVGIIFGVAYLTFRAEFKVQRLWAALGIWQASLVTLIVMLKTFF
jgi:hypothetical protein